MRLLSKGIMAKAVVAVTLAASLFILVIGANAAESVPALKWAPVQSSAATINLTSPTGSITVPCTPTRGGSNLRSYSATGKLVQEISRTSVVDDVRNCIMTPVVDKKGDVYGVPIDPITGAVGRNLLAYSGNTLKWKYPAYCSSSQVSLTAVGADGNVYVTTYAADGVHLIGLAPNNASGKTQPAKVFDVKIPNDCSAMLTPYKYGIFVHGQSSGNGRYYSYAGKYLEQASIGDIWGERLSADGRLFVASFATSLYRSVSVSAFDPQQGKVVWKTTASTPGANVQDATLRQLPDGGVAALVSEQQMLAGGVPATPAVYVKTLTIIDGSGRVVVNQQLVNADASGNVYGGIYVATDTTGKVAVVRDVTYPTGLNYPATMLGISIQVYDSTTRTWTYKSVLRGDNNKAGGPYGYRFDYTNQNYSLAFAAGTLFLSARCMGNCADTNTRLYPVKVSGVGFDYPRVAVLTTSFKPQPAPVAYVALGDSFSSGEGVEPFDPATDSSGDKCHRSNLAYARLITMDPALGADLERGGFWACSGSKTEDILASNGSNNTLNHEIAQIGHLNKDTKIVTLTIGGNDIGFTEFAKACVVPTSWCGPGSPSYFSAMHTIGTILPSLLNTAFEQILQKAPNATVYVLDYPQIVGAKTDARCIYLYQGATPWANAQGARDVVAYIDQVIGKAITAIKSKKAAYAKRLLLIPTNGANSPFKNHGLCDASESYFQNVDNYLVGEIEYIFHPNTSGQFAYAQLIADAMRTEIKG